MIFCQWQPEGGYDYYDSSIRHPIGDDLPTTRMPAPSGGIGVPAQDVGYPLPPDAQYIGSGDKPKGVMTPMARSGIKALSGTTMESNDWIALFFVIGVLCVATIAGRGSNATR